jgi:hypothetical protein
MLDSAVLWRSVRRRPTNEISNQPRHGEAWMAYVFQRPAKEGKVREVRRSVAIARYPLHRAPPCRGDIP